MRLLLTVTGLFLLNITSAQDWSDTMDLDENSQTAFVGDSKLYGYILNVKVVIEPKFEEASNFHCDYASAKLNGRWGVISKNGKWVIKPTHDFISPVVNDQCIIYSDSTFFIQTIGGKKIRHGNFLELDYLKYFTLLKESRDPDRELVLRIAQMYDPLNAHNRHEDPDRYYAIFSRNLIQYYWSTKWFLTEGGLK